ncbi:MAG: Uncharacterised protein [Flavobacteriia bacterium]|nr:MAG: Uncharacterised protein [Flavobacteriia bacterium]
MKLLHTHNAFGWLLAAACVALSCSKEEQMNLPSDQPVFYLSARVDGQNLLMEAGNEDYFMFTRLKADSNGVKEMGGLLVQDTSDLRSGFYLKFRDANALGTGGNTSVDSMLKVGTHVHHHFSQEVIDENRHEVHLSMLDSTDVQQQEWNLVLNGYSSLSSLSTVLDERDLLEWPISLQTTTSSGCMAKVTHYVDLSEPDNCQSRFTYTQNSANSIDCLVDPTAQITYVEWSDGVNLYPGSTQMHWANLAMGKHTICATLHFADGCRHSVCREIEMDATGQVLNAQCQKDFVFDVQPHKVPDSIQAGTAELIYYDGQGVAYSTYYALTPGDINVTSSLPYQVDAWGRNTRAIGLSYSGELRAKNGSAIQVDQLQGVLAVAELN